MSNDVWMPLETHSTLDIFLTYIEAKYNLSIDDYQSLYDWSIHNVSLFWLELWEFLQIEGQYDQNSVYTEGKNFWDGRWFEGSLLNYCENIFCTPGFKAKSDSIAISYHQERGICKNVSYRELYNLTQKLASLLLSLEIKPGDRVVAIVNNSHLSVAAMLACSWVGAVWSSCSPDFGVDGILSRFEQIQPKLMFATNGYFFKGHFEDTLNKALSVAQQLACLENLIFLPAWSCVDNSETKISSVDQNYNFRIHNWSEDLQTNNTENNQIETPQPPVYVRLPFQAPGWILFSSGTTGKPKCITHSVGGVLLEHLKELKLHTDLDSNDIIFYQTSTSWMMWNWLISALGTGARIVLYDGSPLAERGQILWRIAEEQKITVFGTNAKYLSYLEGLKIKPAGAYILNHLRLILSTGSPLLPEQYDYIRDNISSTVQISSISGGTDILGCFALGCPTLPVYRGEMQCRSLGLKVEVYSDQGVSVIGEKGELVCTAPFPNMPISFWGDTDGSKYQAAYFNRFPGVWHHGDYAEITPKGGVIIYGRSDTTLNPGGIRIGSAELYGVVEKIPEIQEALITGKRAGGDEELVLFVKLHNSYELTNELTIRIKNEIRSALSGFHVPKKIIAAPDLPKTHSGKLAELAVKALLNQEEVKQKDALANPECLAFFASLNL